MNLKVYENDTRTFAELDVHEDAINLVEVHNLFPPVAVERVWRRHILDTVEYAEFCRRVVPDGRLIEYTPLSAYNANRKPAYQRARELYVRVYGPVGRFGTWLDPDYYVAEYTVTINTLEGKTVIITVNTSMKLSEFRARVGAALNQPPSFQKLIFKARPLGAADDDRTLGELGVYSDAMVYLVLNL